MRKATIIAIVALLLLTALIIGFAINAKIKSKEATQKAFAELKELKTVEPVYYTETIIQQEINDSRIFKIVNAATKEYMANLKAEYDCQKLETIDTGEMFLSCTRINN